MEATGEVTITVGASGAGGMGGSDHCSAAEWAGGSGGAEMQCPAFAEGFEYYGDLGNGCDEYKRWTLREQCVVDGQCCYIVEVLLSEP